MRSMNQLVRCPNCGILIAMRAMTGNLYAEDTFLLLDALEQDQAELEAQRPTLCLEIG